MVYMVYGMYGVYIWYVCICVWYMISILKYCIIINMRGMRLVIALYCSLHDTSI